MRKGLRGVVAVAALALSGCSGEPSAGDMMSAVEGHPQIRASIGLMVMGDRRWRSPEEGVAAMMKTASVEKASCVAAQGSPGSVCDFRLGFKQPDGKTSYGPPAKGRFFKAANGWAVELMR